MNRRDFIKTSLRLAIGSAFAIELTAAVTLPRRKPSTAQASPAVPPVPITSVTDSKGESILYGPGAPYADAGQIFTVAARQARAAWLASLDVDGDFPLPPFLDNYPPHKQLRFMCTMFGAAVCSDQLADYRVNVNNVLTHGSKPNYEDILTGDDLRVLEHARRFDDIFWRKACKELGFKKHAE